MTTFGWLKTGPTCSIVQQSVRPARAEREGASELARTARARGRGGRGIARERASTENLLVSLVSGYSSFDVVAERGWGVKTST